MHQFIDLADRGGCKHVVDVLYGSPQGHLSRGIATEYILRATDLHSTEVVVCRREEEGRRHEAHFPEEMAFMAFIAFTPFFHSAEQESTFQVRLGPRLAR